MFFTVPTGARETAFGIGFDHLPSVDRLPMAGDPTAAVLVILAAAMVILAVLLATVPPRGARAVPVWRAVRRFLPGRLPARRRRNQVWRIWESPVTGQAIFFK